MPRKMILILVAAGAMTACAFAAPGTWGKEQPKDENQAKAPAAMFNQWLNEFTAAYEQRDGEKMNDLLKRLEEAKQEFPAAPRLEKWMVNVKEAYEKQDVQKMGGLLDNAHQIRERMRERFNQNPNRQRGENAEGIRPEGRQARQRYDGASGPGRGYGYGRPDRVRPYADRPEENRTFEGRMPGFNPRRPMEPQMRPEGFAPGRFRGPMEDNQMTPRMRDRYERPQLDGGMRYGRMAPSASQRPYGELDRPEYGPAPLGRPEFDRPRFSPPMRHPQSGPRYEDMQPEGYRDPQPQERIVPRDFWY
jgi:hypothetical protein